MKIIVFILALWLLALQWHSNYVVDAVNENFDALTERVEALEQQGRPARWYDVAGNKQ